VNILEAAARKAIDTARQEGDAAWAASWNARAISFVAAKDERGEHVAVEIHDRRTCLCGGCQYETVRSVRQVFVVITR
jgi:hypothetical protein